MVVGILVSGIIIGLIVGVGMLFNNKVVKKLDNFKNYKEKGWM